MTTEISPLLSYSKRLAKEPGHFDPKTFKKLLSSHEKTLINDLKSRVEAIKVARAIGKRFEMLKPYLGEEVTLNAPDGEMSVKIYRVMLVFHSEWFLEKLQKSEGPRALLSPRRLVSLSSKSRSETSSFDTGVPGKILLGIQSYVHTGQIKDLKSWDVSDFRHLFVQVNEWRILGIPLYIRQLVIKDPKFPVKAIHSLYTLTNDIALPKLRKVCLDALAKRNAEEAKRQAVSSQMYASFPKNEGTLEEADYATLHVSTTPLPTEHYGGISSTPPIPVYDDVSSAYSPRGGETLLFEEGDEMSIESSSEKGGEDSDVEKNNDKRETMEEAKKDSKLSFLNFRDLETLVDAELLALLAEPWKLTVVDFTQCGELSNRAICIFLNTHCKTLEQINVADTQFSGEGLEGPFPNVQILNVRSCANISKDFITVIPEIFPKPLSLADFSFSNGEPSLLIPLKIPTLVHHLIR